MWGMNLCIAIKGNSMSAAKKIVTIVGARPQFIKAATVSRAIKRHNESSKTCMEEFIIHTGQHYDHGMSEIFFDTMDIPAPTSNLGVKLPTHGGMTGQMIELIENELLTIRPDMVLVYGDTNSTLAGALAGVKLHTPVSHVEAGLRSFNRRMPEEINRVLTDHASSLLFSPTQKGMDNLAAEGIHPGKGTGKELFDEQPRPYLVGDVMYDGVLHYLPKAEGCRLNVDGMDQSLTDYTLCTIHRAENTDDPGILAGIIEALGELADTRPVVLPLHPRTKARLDAMGVDPRDKGITIIEPVGYLEMLDLLSNASLVLTDSGGLQKEAFFLAKPCITLRDETEWTEAVDSGWNILVGNQKQAILDRVNSFSKPDGSPPPLYGDGKAADHIVRIMAESM